MSDTTTTMTDTNTEEDWDEVIPIEVDVSVDNDEFEPAPDEDEEYEVEEILNKRIKKGQTEYLVKWKGGYSLACVLVPLLFSSHSLRLGPSGAQHLGAQRQPGKQCFRNHQGI